jgi:pyridoxine 5'-phosphate synthase PdxJ
MKTFQVSLTKTYTVNIVADDKERAKRLVEFYTGDIQDISTEKDHLAEDFSIEQIENQTNDAIDCDELSDE